MGLAIPDIRKKGWQVLVKELGYANAIKFLLLYEKGEGNYLIEKEKIFGKMKARDIYEEIKKIQKSEG